MFDSNKPADVVEQIKAELQHTSPNDLKLVLDYLRFLKGQKPSKLKAFQLAIVEKLKTVNTPWKRDILLRVLDLAIEFDKRLAHVFAK